MKKKKINQWNITQDVSRESHCSKPRYLYFIYHKYEWRYKPCPHQKNFTQVWSTLSAHKQALGQHLANSASIQAPISLRNSSDEWSYLNGIHASKTVQSKHRSFSDCMHDLYNSVNHTIDSTLSLHSNLNWVFLKIDMHDFLMRESSVN